MKYIIPFFASLMCLIMVSCSSDALSDIEASYDTELKSIGNPIKVSLNLTASDFSSDNVSTRAEDPITYTPDKYDEALMEEEKVINDLWVFEYDNESGSLLIDPIYVTISNNEISNLSIELSDNSGKEVTLYFIANAAGAASADTWLDNVDKSLYSTISSLEALNIPFKDAILFAFDETSEAYQTPTDFALPMSAIVTQELPTEEEIEEMEPIKVSLQFMVSKLMFGTSLDKESFEEFNLTNDFQMLSSELYFVNAPTACYKVGALGNALTTTKYDYSSLYVTWLAGEEKEIDFLSSSSDVTYQYVLYMPENIQGVNGSSTSKAENAPATSYTTSTKTWNTDVNTSSWDSDLSILGYMSSTDALCLQSIFNVNSNKINVSNGKLYSSVIFPGGNEEDNFNVRRSCVYHVMFTLKYAIDIEVNVTLTITHNDNELYFDNTESFDVGNYYPFGN